MDRSENRLRTTKTKLYTSKEKRELIRRLLAMRQDVSWTSVYNDPQIALAIPSRRTIYRIFEDPENCRIRDATAAQIERLLLITEGGASVAPPAELMHRCYSTLKDLMSVSDATSKRFLETYTGCYKCIRLTTKSEQILVTHLRITDLARGTPSFLHVESIPDKASGIPGRGNRVTRHEGLILARHRRATFLAPTGSLKQLTCVISTNTSRPAFSGVLLTVDAKHEFPFAARVFITKSAEIADDAVVDHPEFGLFSVDDERYGSFMPYIQNNIPPNSVLFPETDV